MLNIYRTDELVLNKLTDFRDGVWVQMVDPTSNELSRVAEQYEIELDDLATAMDDEESSRISLEDGYTLILVDIPSPEVRHEKKMYTTIPLGIILISAQRRRCVSYIRFFCVLRPCIRHILEE